MRNYVYKHNEHVEYKWSVSSWKTSSFLIYSVFVRLTSHGQLMILSSLRAMKMNWRMFTEHNTSSWGEGERDDQDSSALYSFFFNLIISVFADFLSQTLHSNFKQNKSETIKNFASVSSAYWRDYASKMHKERLATWPSDCILRWTPGNLCTWNQFPTGSRLQ